MNGAHTLLLLEATMSHILTGYMYLMQLFIFNTEWIISLVIAKSYFPEIHGFFLGKYIYQNVIWIYAYFKGNSEKLCITAS